jgi:hypothetical protein
MYNITNLQMLLRKHLRQRAIGQALSVLLQEKLVSSKAVNVEWLSGVATESKLQFFVDDSTGVKNITIAGSIIVIDVSDDPLKLLIVLD